MTELISSLETAEAGSRELSDRVLEALGWKKDTLVAGNAETEFWVSPEGWAGVSDDGGISGPDPTRSLDDALALVPEGWFWSMHRSGKGPSSNQYWCRLSKREWPEKWTGWENGGPTDSVVNSQASTPAIALCIALIRAEEG